jgi:signal transduction histidine kinase
MKKQTLTPEELNRLLALKPTSPEPVTNTLESPIFKLLASTGRESLAKLMTEQYYAAGDVVFRENETGDAMYIIRSGRVLIVKGNLRSPAVLSCQGVGAIIGEMALLEDSPRSASVIAAEDVCLLRISRENFQQILDSNSSFGLSMLKVLSTRLRAANEAQNSGLLTKKRLIRRVSELQSEKQQLLDLQQRHQETIDLIIHDLRNPLTLIFSAISMMEMTLPPDVLYTNQELLDLININCEYMQRLIDSMLDMAQMDANEAELLLTPTDLPSLIRRTYNRMAFAAQRDDITFHAAIPARLPLVAIDEEKIDRVLANLIDNAVKYTLEGGQVTVEVEQKNEDILVSITNTAATISPEDRAHIFDRFAHAPRQKSKEGGFGLGLAFCRMTVEAHGGRIWVEPGAGGIGNRFVFSLPLAIQSMATPLAA